MTTINLGKEYSTPASRNQVPLGESHHRPKPRRQRPRYLPAQFYDPRPLKEGGSGQKHKIRDAKLADWWALRCYVGFDKTVADVAHVGHWNINTARKYDSILKKRKLFTVEDGDRQFDHYFGKDGKLKICQRVKRTPHPEALPQVAPAPAPPIKSYQSQRPKSYQYKVPPETSTSKARREEPDQSERERRESSSLSPVTTIPPQPTAKQIEKPEPRPPQQVALSVFFMVLCRCPGVHPCKIADFMKWMILTALQKRGPAGIPRSIPYWVKYSRHFRMPDYAMFGSFELEWPRAAKQLSRDERKRWKWFFAELDRRCEIASAEFEDYAAQVAA
jgi:hypothetical protein